MRRTITQKVIFAIICLFLLCACAAPQATATSTPAPSPIPPTATQPPLLFSMVKLESEAIAGNIIGQKSEWTITVYLPPSYNSSAKHYPVIYYLPGYGNGAINGISFPKDIDAVMTSGSVQEMILVIIPGGSSFYANSPITGNWEDFVVKEVVSYVDEHYRTIADVASRGISGHSMGGYGSWNIAMHHPDVFSAVYSMSPGLFDENGLWESQMYGDFMVAKFMGEQADILAMPEEDRLQAVLTSPDFFTMAYGMAFAPNPQNPPFYFDYPYSEVDGKLVRDDEIWKRWESGFGNTAEEIVKYKDNLLSLKAITIEYGIQDELIWIPKGSIYLDEQLTAAGVPHEVFAFDGTHQSKLAERVREHMLPFFSEILAGE